MYKFTFFVFTSLTWLHGRNRGDSGNVLSWSVGEERRALDLSFLSGFAESRFLSFPPGDGLPASAPGVRLSAPGRGHWLPQ